MKRAIRIFAKALGLVILFAAAWLGFTALEYHLDGSQEPPSGATGSVIQKILNAVQRDGGRDLYPRRFEACGDDLRRARFEMNLQLAGTWGFRDFSGPERRMDWVFRDASLLWRDLSKHRSSSRSAALLALDRAAADLEQAEQVTAVSAQEPYVRSKLAAAAINLKRAKAYQDCGRYDQALDCARESIKASSVAHARSRMALARYDDPGHLSAWRGWIRQAVDASRASGVALVVIKERHRLEVYRGGKVVRSFPVDLGANSINQKLHAGDRTTPEGLYYVTQKKKYGQSKYGMALLLNYPNADDKRRFQAAKERGELTSRTRIGGLIEIHGDGGRGFDWTDGCVAPDNRDMEVLFRETSVGTMVAIVGSDGGVGPVRSALRQGDSR